MKVLLYNWAPYDQTPNLGSGVSMICRNLIDGLLEKGASVSFLYSGTDYAFFGRAPFVRAVTNEHDARVSSHSLVNSPIVAPAVFNFGNPDGDVSERKLEECFATFLERTGPYDAIHFHSLEGLTAACLRIAKRTGARVLYSLHNYWTVCPQVNLWQNGTQRCRDDRDGIQCVTCQPERKRLTASMVRLKRWNQLGGALKLWRLNSCGAILRASHLLRLLCKRLPRLGSWIIASYVDKGVVLSSEERAKRARRYLQRRRALLDTIRNEVDVVVSGSERASAIHRHYGLQGRVETLHYPVRAFSVPRENPAKRAAEAPLRLVFLGKVQSDKGFGFLVDALTALPADVAKLVELTVAGRSLFRFDLEARTQELRAKIRRTTIVESYANSKLPKLLAGTHLTMVPSLWEDTLPQVVLESLACRVAVLGSRRGGIDEIVVNPSFLFDPDIEGDLIAKLVAIARRPSLLEDFWRTFVPPPTVARYAETMRTFYDGPTPAVASSARK